MILKLQRLNVSVKGSLNNACISHWKKQQIEAISNIYQTEAATTKTRELSEQNQDNNTEKVFCNSNSMYSTLFFVSNLLMAILKRLFL